MRSLIAALLLLCAVPAYGFNFDWGGSVRALYEDLVQSLSWTSTDPGWSTTTYDFGSHDVGTTDAATFTITNSGNDTAEDVLVKAIGTGFSLYSTSTFGNISAGRILVAKVRFSPNGAGLFSGFASYSAPNIPRVSVALSGTGVGVVSPYTQYFGYSFNVADGSPVTTADPVSGNSWTSETDASTLGAISGGAYVVSLAGVSTSAYVLKSAMTARTDIEAKADIKFNAVTGVGAGYLRAIKVTGPSSAEADLEVYTTGGVYSGVRVKYHNGTALQTGTDYPYTFSAGQYYTFALRYKKSTDTVTADGSYQVLINDAIVVPATSVATAIGSPNALSMGVVLQSSAVTNTFSFKNVILGYK